MADKKITELNLHLPLELSDVIPVVNSNETKKSSLGSLNTFVRNQDTPLTASGITVSGDIVPTTPQGATLGTIDKPFRELFLQSGSLSIESDTPGDPSAIISNKNANLQVSIGGMRLVESGSSFISPTGSFDYVLISGSAEMTGSLNISGSIQYPEWIDFKTDNSVTPQTARMWWDPTNQTLNVGMNNDVILNMGEEMYYPPCVNGDTGTILNGTLVMVDPNQVAQGQRLNVIRAITDGTYPSDLIVGVATQDILENEDGYITWFGAVRNVPINILEDNSLKDPLENWAAGNILYPNPTMPGGLTNVQPTTPNLKSTIAVLTTVNGNNANMLVRPSLGPRMGDINNLQINSLNQGELIMWDSGSNYYKTTTQLSGSYGITGSLDVQGSVSVSDVLNLPPQNPLPSGTIGDLAVSGSNLYFYNGTWTQIV